VRYSVDLYLHRVRHVVSVVVAELIRAVIVSVCRWNNNNKTTTQTYIIYRRIISWRRWCSDTQSVMFSVINTQVPLHGSGEARLLQVNIVTICAPLYKISDTLVLSRAVAAIVLLRRSIFILFIVKLFTFNTTRNGDEIEPVISSILIIHRHACMCVCISISQNRNVISIKPLSSQARCFWHKLT
jgi:hypothetical protein